MEVTIVPHMIKRRDHRTKATFMEEWPLSFVCVNGKSVGYVNSVERPGHFLPLAYLKKDKAYLKAIMDAADGLFTTCDGLPDYKPKKKVTDEFKEMGDGAKTPGIDN